MTEQTRRDAAMIAALGAVNGALALAPNANAEMAASGIEQRDWVN